MLSIAIYSDKDEDVIHLKSLIQDFLIENKIMAKLSVFNTPNDLVLIPSSYDIYIMDMDSQDDVIALGKEMKNIDVGSYFIYISSDETKAYKATKVYAHYYLNKPIEKEELNYVLKAIKKRIQDDNVIIKIPSGERRVRINNLNYINIVKRCLCYHLQDGTMFDGQTLRSSFEKAIYPLQENKSFLFIPPSLLINIGEIKILNSDNAVFENDDVVYFPKKSYDMIHDKWLNYNRIVNG